MERVVMLMVCLLSGCAAWHAQWTPTGYDGVPRERAQAECAFESDKAQASAAGGGRSAQISAGTDVYFSCMQAKGFRLVKAGSPEGRDLA